MLSIAYAAQVTAPSVSARPPRRLAFAGLGIFLLLGMLYPILGPALPGLSEQFGLSAKGASLLLSLNSAGAFAGVLLAGALSLRVPSPRRAALALGLLIAACLGLTLAPTFALALAASLGLGLGFGILDVTINVWVSTSYGERSASVLNLLSASFGVGAVLAPLAVGLANGDFHLPLLGCASLAALLLLPVLTLRAAPAPPLEIRERAAGGRDRLLLLGFVALFLTYVGVEGGVGAWEVTHLRDVLSVSTADASRLTALFWVSFTFGRLISAALALRLRPARMVVGTLVLAALSLALATVPAAAPLAYTLAGLFLAPVFTTGLVWLTRTLPGSGATTLVFASAFLGPVLFSPVVGAFKDAHGATAIPITLLGITLLCLGVALWLWRTVRTPHERTG